MRRQALRDQSPDPGVAWVVHHVQHDAGDGQVLNDGPAVGTVTAGLGGIGHGVVEHPQHLVVRGDGPEPLPVRCVDGRLVPPHRRNLPMDAEYVMRETVGERVEIGEVDPAQVVRHGAILTAVLAGVKNGAPGA